MPIKYLTPAIASVIFLTACNPYSGSRTHVEEATLTAEDLATSRSVDADSVAGLPIGLRGSCPEVNVALSQLENLGSGSFRFPEPGRMDVNRMVWNRLPVAQQRSLLQLLAAQTSCAGQQNGATSQDLQAVVRDIENNEVLASLNG